MSFYDAPITLPRNIVTFVVQAGPEGSEVEADQTIAIYEPKKQRLWYVLPKQGYEYLDGAVSYIEQGVIVKLGDWQSAVRQVLVFFPDDEKWKNVTLDVLERVNESDADYELTVGEAVVARFVPIYETDILAVRDEIPVNPFAEASYQGRAVILRRATESEKL